LIAHVPEAIARPLVFRTFGTVPFKSN
jgi:hypothetical protein